MNIIYRMFIYDFLYFAADQLVKKYNPCQLQISESGAKCIGVLATCCGGCKHISDSGCIVACLFCKLGLCYSATKRIRKLYPDVLEKLLVIQTISFKYNLGTIRTSRQWTYKNLKRYGDDRGRQYVMNMC